MQNVNINNRFSGFLVFFLVLLVSPIHSRDENSDFFRITSENDSYGPLTDEYYTSGNRFEYFSNRLPSIQKSLFHLLWKDKIKESCDKYTGKCVLLQTDGYSLNQLIFTPHNLSSRDVNQGDRPYSGLAYVGNSYSAVFEKFIFNSEMKLGSTGNASDAEEAQRKLHQFFDFIDPKGWNHQIEQQKVANYDTNLIFPMSKEIAVHSGFGVGNMDSNFNIGTYFRFGKIQSKDTFSGMSIRDFGSGGIYNSYPQDSDDSEYYFFIYPSLKTQFWNVTVQGNHSSYQSNDINTKGILDDRSISEKERFLLYKYGLLNTNDRDLTQEILLFNAYFNDGERLDRKQVRSLLIYLLRTDSTLGKEMDYVILYNILQFDGRLEYGLGKYLAFKSILESSKISPEFHDSLLLIAYLNGEFNGNKETYRALRHVQGSLQTGMAIKSETLFASFSITLTSQDFYQSGNLPPFHMWGTVQAGIRF